MVVVFGLFVIVSVLQWFNDGSGQAIAVLYILPIALLGVTRGERWRAGQARRPALCCLLFLRSCTAVATSMPQGGRFEP